MLAHKSWRHIGLASILGLLPASGSGAFESRLVSRSADGLKIVLQVDLPEPRRVEMQVDGESFTRLELPEYVPEGSPGAPQLCVGTRLLALPPFGRAELHVLESRLDDLGRMRLAPRPVPGARSVPGLDGAGQTSEMLSEELRYDPALYVADGPRSEFVRLGEPGWLRHQQVVPLEVRPLLYDPGSGRTRLLRHLRLEIDLQPAVGGAKADEGDALAARLATSASWERIYGGALLNARGSEAWRRAPRRAQQIGGPLKGGLLRPGLLGEEEWRLRVRASGPTRVPAATLLDPRVGFPAGIPTDKLRLVLRRFAAARPLEPDILEIPILVVDADGDGLFGSGDSFIFYAESPSDDPTSGDRWARYSFDNVYFLSYVNAGTPARMRLERPVTGAVPGPGTFLQKIVCEKDSVMNLWVFADDAPLYFWGGLAAEAWFTFPVPGRAPGAPLGVCLETQADWIRRPFTAYLETGSGSGRIRTPIGGNTGDAGGGSAPPRQTTCNDSIPDAEIVPGDARVYLHAEPVPEDDKPDRVPYLDRIRLSYRAQYVATNDRIRCTSGGASGAVAFTIAGWSGAPLRAFDVTEPKSPAAFPLAVPVGGNLVLADSIPSSALRTYVVVPDAGIPALGAGAIEHLPADPDPLLQALATRPVGSYDVLVVAQDGFADGLSSWVTLRQSQGHRVRVVRTSEAYDAFSGGLLHFEAIHRLCQLAFQNWGIESVLLVGDGSEDAAHLYADSGPNLVPARVRYFAVASSSGGGAEYRNDMDDKYYAEVAGGDWYPDLVLGRLPVSNAAGLQSVLDKTIRYDTPQPGDDGAWRKRVLLFADDEWVKRPDPILGFPHLRGCSEWDFLRSIMRTCETVHGAFPGDLRCVPFYLKTFSDMLFPRVPEHRPLSADSVQNCNGGDPNYTRPHNADELHIYLDVTRQALVDSVGEGVLFFALQSHANRTVVADENIMAARGTFTEPEFRNAGKPFVFFGFGCHLNEYGPAHERASSNALGELLVLQPQGGAVASYASTGFEFLDINNMFHEAMWREIFEKRFSKQIGGGGVDSDTLESHWSLGELLEIAEIEFGDRDLASRYVLLGDPMLRLDAGVPRFKIEEITNGFLQTNNRLVIVDKSRPLGFRVTVNDEQGIDSLWVVQRFAGGVPVPVDSVTITARLDTMPQVRAKRSYGLAFRVRAEQCNFDLVVGARDLSGHVSEFVGRMAFDHRLLANGLPIEGRGHVDPRTAFRLEINGCAPLDSLPLQTFLDERAVRTNISSDASRVNWKADFTTELAPGPHALRFVYAGRNLSAFEVDVGGFGLGDVLAFPNPMRDYTRIVFHLQAPIAGGGLRIMDLNGRTVLRRDLGEPGVLKTEYESPAGAVGSAVGWNFVEWDGRDAVGDKLANGVYFYDLRIQDASGHALRRREKLVIMR